MQTQGGAICCTIDILRWTCTAGLTTASVTWNLYSRLPEEYSSEMVEIRRRCKKGKQGP